MTERDAEIVEAVARAIDPRAWAAYDQAHREPWGDSERMLAKENVAPSIVKARAAIAAYEAALARRGWAIVPGEPTEEMIEAGGKSEPFILPGTGPNGLWHPGEIIANSAWRAMLAAAPKLGE